MNQYHRHMGCRMISPLCLLLFVLVACGGSSSKGNGAGPDTGPHPGVLSVHNDTPWDLDVAWLHRGESDEATVRRVRISPGGQRPLIDEIWPAGTAVSLDLVLQLDPSDGPRIRRKAAVDIDGDVTVTVSASAQDPFDVDIRLLAYTNLSSVAHSAGSQSLSMIPARPGRVAARLYVGVTGRSQVTVLQRLGIAIASDGYAPALSTQTYRRRRLG